MTSFRLLRTALAATTLLAAIGCRTAGVDNLARKDPPPARPERGAIALLREHNKNAEKVVSLEAQPSVSSASPGATGSLHGRLALELPRNFKLAMMLPISGQAAADIGSNHEEFWFWYKDSPEKAIYYCNYDSVDASPLAAGFQPDWIIEALGLRVITDDEAAGIKVSPGKDPDTVVLTQRQKTPQGETVIKETVLNETTHRIKEHWVYTADHKTAVAHAVVSAYKEYPVPSDPGFPEKVYLPTAVRLEWPQQEKMTLDVTLARVKINPKFTPEQRQARFVEPMFKGFARINLADRAPMATGNTGNAPTDAPTSVRESLPAPPPRVRLSDPAPLGLDGATRRRRDPAAVAAKISSRTLEEVVEPPIPTIDSPPLPETIQARSGNRQPLTPWVGQ